MSQNTSSARKREILMQVARGRLGVLDAVDGARRNTGACVSALPSIPMVVRYGTMLGAGLLGGGVVFRLLRHTILSRVGVKGAPSNGGFLRYLLVQLVTLVLLPWLRQRVLQASSTHAMKKKSLATLFFRWIGLER